MKLILSIMTTLLICQLSLTAQKTTTFSCAHDTYQATLQDDLAYQEQLKVYNQAYVRSFRSSSRSEGEIFTLPTVVHIVKGVEKLELITEPELTDELIISILEEANDLFRHTSEQTFDNPYSGVDTEIEFCLTKLTPNDSITTGIVRHTEIVDPSSSEFYEFIQASLWDVTKYNNVYILSNFIDNYCSLYMSTFDATFFSAECFQADVFTHEMGHYLSLEHTFEEGCDNSNCLVNGDYVCDTPPKVGKGMNDATCEQPANSCASDEEDEHNRNPYRPVVQGGLGDQPDLVENYMDDTRECWGAFTKGQKKRMRFNIKTRRFKQINNNSCALPDPICDSPIISVGNSYNSTTEGSTYDLIGNISRHCGSGGLGAPNKFYLLNGMDKEVRISLCNSEYDTRIDVYSVTESSCNTGDFTCVGGNDDFCELQSSITFFAHANQDYYVMVHGYNDGQDNTGAFTLTVEYADETGCIIASNSECGFNLIDSLSGSAQPIPLQKDMVGLSYTMGNNSCTRSGNNPSCDPDGEIEDIWYKFEAGKKDTTIIKLKLMSNAPTQSLNFAVYNACNGEEIMCQISKGEITVGKLSHLTEDKNYFIQVWSSKDNVSDFGIAVYEKAAKDTLGQKTNLPNNIKLGDTIESIGSNSALQINPNPIATEATLKYYSKDNHPASLQVFDLNGQLRLDLPLENNKGWNIPILDFTPLTAGMYYVILQTYEERFTKKIIVVE